MEELGRASERSTFDTVVDLASRAVSALVRPPAGRFASQPFASHGEHTSFDGSVEWRFPVGAKAASEAANPSPEVSVEA